jgi:hypothetical protein
LGYKDQSFKKSWSPHNKTYLEIFNHFLPFMWLQNVLLPNTSAELEMANSPPLRLGELMRFIGMRLLMLTLQGWTTDKYWYYDPIPKPQEDGPCPYNFMLVMARRQFYSITKCLVFSDVPPPSYCDKFWQVRQMIKAWNENIANIFVAAWVVCLNESMSIWHNKWTCPGWIFCPCKPHPFGSEYHTACCGICNILFSIEMVEGKDAPPQIDVPFSPLGKTVGLPLRMSKSPLWPHQTSW